MAAALKGMAELMRRLDALGKLEGANTLRSAVRAGMRPVLKQAVAEIPKSDAGHTIGKKRGGFQQYVAPGFAARNIAMQAFSLDGGRVGRAQLGVRKKAFYAVQFVERGTRYQRKQEWLVPALDQTQDAALEAVANYLRKAVDKAARK